MVSTIEDWLKRDDDPEVQAIIRRLFALRPSWLEQGHLGDEVLVCFPSSVPGESPIKLFLDELTVKWGIVEEHLFYRHRVEQSEFYRGERRTLPPDAADMAVEMIEGLLDGSLWRTVVYEKNGQWKTWGFHLPDEARRLSEEWRSKGFVAETTVWPGRKVE